MNDNSLIGPISWEPIKRRCPPVPEPQLNPVPSPGRIVPLYGVVVEK